MIEENGYCDNVEKSGAATLEVLKKGGMTMSENSSVNPSRLHPQGWEGVADI